MPDQGSASKCSIVSHDSVCTRLQSLLRIASLTWTDAQLEEASGVPARTIKAYRVEGKEPSLSNALSLAVVLGAPALNQVLALIGYVARPLEEADPVNVNAIVATGLKHFSTIATAAADGRIDHLEAPLCRDAADMIIATIMPLSSAGDAA